jgi:biotin-dependent carboxylase-like uncharacterized protein
MIEVINPGLLLTVQDRGRAGWAHIGVPESGAADPLGRLWANIRVGNDESYPVLETTLTGAEVRFHEATTVAVSGPEALIEINGRPVPFGGAYEVEEGDVLKVGPPAAGVRNYIAVAGGIQAPLTLGSASTDLLTGLGPPPLGNGDRLGFARLPTGKGAEIEILRHDKAMHIGVSPGPHDELDDGGSAFSALREGTWVVSPRSNRIGVRLERGEGPFMRSAHSGDIRSFGIPSGAIQLPPDGNPILLLADRPVTGGYPVVGVVGPSGQTHVAQLRPGETVRFAIDANFG